MRRIVNAGDKITNYVDENCGHGYIIIDTYVFDITGANIFKFAKAMNCVTAFVIDADTNGKVHLEFTIPNIFEFIE